MGTAVEDRRTFTFRSSKPTSRSSKTLAQALLPPGLAVTLAALLSLPRLGTRSLWLDETYTVGATRELLDTWRATGGTQALYYLSVWPVAHFSTEPVWLRLPSAIFGLLAVAVVYEVGRRLGGRTMGTLAACGLALSWGLARYSLEARSYTLALLLVSSSWLAVVAVVQTPSEDSERRWWRVFFVATLLAPLAHGLSILHFIAQVIALTFAPGARRWVRPIAMSGAALVGVMAALSLLGAGEVAPWVNPLNIRQFRGTSRLLLGYGNTGLILGAVTGVAAAQVLRRYWRERTPESWCRALPVFWALGAPVLIVVLSLVRPYTVPRYLFGALPGFLLLMAGLVANLRWVTVKATISVAIALLLLSDQGRAITHGTEDWPALTECIQMNAIEGDVHVTLDKYRPPVDYYWQADPDAVGVTALAPDAPLGEVRRLYEPIEYARDVLLTWSGGSSVWYSDRGTGGRERVEELVEDPEVMALYEVDGPWYFKGNPSLVRFDPISGPPRRPVTCDSASTD